MKYTLITSKGRVMTFYIRQVAECYQAIYGGTLISDQLYAEAYAEMLT